MSTWKQDEWLQLAMELATNWPRRARVMLKPKRWPRMGYGEGRRWDWDAKTQECILRCTVAGVRVRIRIVRVDLRCDATAYKLSSGGGQAEADDPVEPGAGQREHQLPASGSSITRVRPSAGDERQGPGLGTDLRWKQPIGEIVCQLGASA